MELVHDIAAEIAALEQRRNRLAADIRAQERLLADLKGRVAQVQCAQLAQAEADFEQQVAEVEAKSAWLADSRSGLIARLRQQIPDRLQRGKELDLYRVVRDAPIERIPE
jgi:chromosome segregation ATPase